MLNCCGSLAIYSFFPAVYKLFISTIVDDNSRTTITTFTDKIDNQSRVVL